MNWYKSLVMSLFLKQADVVGLEPALQNWGIAKGKTPEEISFVIQRLKQIEQQRLAAGELAKDNWLNRQFAELLFGPKQQPQAQSQFNERKQRELENITNKAKGISAQYWQWVLQLMQTENRTDFDQSVFDYFKAKNVDPLNPLLTYEQAEQASEEYHQQFYKKKEKATYKTPVTAGEPIGDMFMVEVNEEDQVAEGANMQNCVGEDCTVGNGTRLFSLRDKNNGPHVQVSLEGNRISEIKGKQNISPDIRYSEYVVEWLQKHPDIDLGALDNMPLTEESFAAINHRFAPDNLLTYAAKIGFIKYVQKAIADGATSFNGAMIGAAAYGQEEIVELMIQKGANEFNWAMERAAENGQKEIVELLIQKYKANDFNRSMLGAAKYGQKEIVELMIQKYKANNFNGAMSMAAEGGQKEIVELMIQQYGANDFDGAMRSTAYGGHKEIVELMIQHGATDFNRAMVSAARSGHKEIVELMIQHGATSFNRSTSMAVENGHTEIEELLEREREREKRKAYN